MVFFAAAVFSVLKENYRDEISARNCGDEPAIVAIWCQVGFGDCSLDKLCGRIFNTTTVAKEVESLRAGP